MRGLRVFAAAAVAFFCVVSYADISDLALVVEATNGAGHGTFEVSLDELEWNEVEGSWGWSLGMPVQIMNEVSPRAVVAELQAATVALVDTGIDKLVNLSFSVQAGEDDTLFEVSSALLSFGTVDPAEGLASASYSVTDVDGDAATLTGSAPNGGAYLTQYNGFVPNGTTFAELLRDPIVAPAQGSITDFEMDPMGGGFRPIDDPVSDMSAQVLFSLTANDLASGTTNYVIVPEPGAVVLLAVGAVALLRRR